MTSVEQTRPTGAPEISPIRTFGPDTGESTTSAGSSLPTATTEPPAGEPSASESTMGEPSAITAAAQRLSRLRDRMRRLRRSYAPHEHRPLGGYSLSLSMYAGLTTGLALLIRASGRPLPERPAPADVLLISVATHKLSRLLAKDAVTSPIRAPFTRYQEPIGHAEVAEEVRTENGAARHAIGELLSCPFCLAMWFATAFTGGLVLAPRATRLAATALTAVAASDFLQLAYCVAKNAAEPAAAETKERPSE